MKYNNNNIKTEALTEKELDLLLQIKEAQNEEGHSDFTSEDYLSKSIGGILSSLEKKGFIYNSYEMSAKELRELDLSANFKMWCFTHKAVFMVGRPNGWSYYDSGYKMEIEFDYE